jgi:hypothetical protein
VPIQTPVAVAAVTPGTHDDDGGDHESALVPGYMGERKPKGVGQA